MNYNVGDKIKYILEEGEFKIIATKEVPYQHKVGEFRVEDGHDFIIVKCGTKQFESFIQVKVGNIEPLQQ